MPWRAVTTKRGDHRVAFVLKGGVIAAVKAEHYGSQAAARAAAEGFNGRRQAEVVVSWTVRSPDGTEMVLPASGQLPTDLQPGTQYEIRPTRNGVQ